MRYFILSVVLTTINVVFAQNNTSKSLVQVMSLMDSEIQSSTQTQIERSKDLYYLVSQENTILRKNKVNGVRLERVVLVNDKMKEINEFTNDVFKYLDLVKAKLLLRAGEDTGAMRIAKDQWFSRVILGELTNPSAKAVLEDSIFLFKKINEFREELLYNVGNYEWGRHSYNLPKLPLITGFESEKDLMSKIQTQLDLDDYNYIEDKNILIDLNYQLYQTGLKAVYARSESLVLNLCLISLLQRDISFYQYQALEHWRTKIPIGIVRQKPDNLEGK